MTDKQIRNISLEIIASLNTLGDVSDIDKKIKEVMAIQCDEIVKEIEIVISLHEEEGSFKESSSFEYCSHIAWNRARELRDE